MGQVPGRRYLLSVADGVQEDCRKRFVEALGGLLRPSSKCRLRAAHLVTACAHYKRHAATTDEPASAGGYTERRL